MKKLERIPSKQLRHSAYALAASAAFMISGCAADTDEKADGSASSTTETTLGDAVTSVLNPPTTAEEAAEVPTTTTTQQLGTATTREFVPPSTVSPSPETSAPTTSTTRPATTTTLPEVPVQLNAVFDDLGGGSSIIQVYGDPSETGRNSANGTFRDGDSRPAECKTIGRTVFSDPNVGELDRNSNYWVRIDGTPGLAQFATAVYLENPDSLLPQLPDC